MLFNLLPYMHSFLSQEFRLKITRDVPDPLLAQFAERRSSDPLRTPLPCFDPPIELYRKSADRTWPDTGRSSFCGPRQRHNFPGYVTPTPTRAEQTVAAAITTKDVDSHSADVGVNITKDLFGVKRRLTACILEDLGLESDSNIVLTSDDEELQAELIKYGLYFCSGCGKEIDLKKSSYA